MKSPNSKQIWILGAGTFGRKAVNALLNGKDEWAVTVIDHSPERLKLAGVNCICSDAVDWLLAHFSVSTPAAEMIVPALPIHVAAEWLRRTLQDKGISVRPADLPESYIKALPNLITPCSNRAYTSFAEERCPESCDEPEGYCYLTGENREMPLFELMNNASPPGIISVVIRSYQLAAGVGGIHTAHLADLLETSINIGKGTIIVGTSCRCHGVVDCLQIG
jgi:hypothetical protein